MNKGYQICTRCVMDTSDPDIAFDDNGVCYHCHRYDARVKRELFTGTKGRDLLYETVERIKREGRRKRHDCVIGVSGGVDSSYLALKAAELGLRPLAVHLDNGWDSELAVSNIHGVLGKLGIELYTHVIDWEEFRDLQVSFIKAATPDLEIPSDHAIATLMRATAKRIGVRHVIIGFNVRTESHLPRAWSHGHYDWTYIKGVHRRFGSTRLRTFPRMGFWTYKRQALTLVFLQLLNYLDYDKKTAAQELEAKTGWRNYGSKHHESIYTRFYQGYILPLRFGFDKRRCHLSSLVCSGQMLRAEALDELGTPPYPVEQQEDDRRYVIKKLGLTESEFDKLMALPKKTYWDYPNSAANDRLFDGIASAYRVVKRALGVSRSRS